MEKPSLDEMYNFEYILSWFNEKWTMDYKITDDDFEKIHWIINQKKDKWNSFTDQDCWWKLLFLNIDNTNIIKNLKADNIKKWDIIKLEDKYNWGWYCYRPSLYGWNCIWIDLNKKQKNFIKNNWWVVYDPKWNLVNYQLDWNVPAFEFDEEWTRMIRLIWWEKEKYRRYPQNSMYVTSDLLLHIFHLLFDNNLKYYEWTIARDLMWTISRNNLEKFSNLLSNSEWKVTEYYDFLTAYWSIPSTLFMEKSELIILNSYKEDLENEQLNYKLKSKNLVNYKNYVSLKYHDSLSNELQSILDATKKEEDYLMKEFVPDSSIFNELSIKQDFTQFKPRSHYNSDSLLKTYFMWMKFLMKEKFYFSDKKLAIAALIQANNLSDKDKQNFDELYQFTKNIIWDDDDINIYDLQKYIKSEWWKTDEDIVDWMSDIVQKELMTMKQQNIISTTYETKNNREISEKQAHEKTVWFVFFGEKTTIDSWIYDQLTAWSAEIESTEKPSIVTALSIPTVLSDNTIAGDLVKLWWSKNLSKEHNKWYMKYQDMQKEKIQYFDFTKNIYHKWIDTLNYLFVRTDQNNPYFMLDPTYKIKSILTYMWSYSELKHDTLLYAKQTSAELWGGWDECSIYVSPPALPVPKWYIEPNIELIDKLIELSNDTNNIFNDKKYNDFIEYLKFIRKIAIAQTKNEIIPDDDFEKLRVYYLKLQSVTTPKMYIWNPLNKEERWSIISDIYTSSDFWPLYEAVGRPQLIFVNIKDANWARTVVWPIYTHYEFYWKDSPIKSDSRLTDEDWQNAYDKLDKSMIMSEPMRYIMDKINE